MMLSIVMVNTYIQAGVDDGEVCRLDNGGAEDVEMGKCMEGLGVKAGDSR